MAKDRIQITSDIHTNASQFHETIHDKSTDEIKTVDHPKGQSTSRSTTITTNPYVCETDGTNEKKDEAGTSSTAQTVIEQQPTEERKLQDYDTSQL